MAIEGVDYSRSKYSDHTPSVATLKAMGKHFAGRYAVNDKSPVERGITAAEYQRLVAGGLDVFLYWEGLKEWMLGGWDAGVRAAKNAQANIVAAGIPPGTPVYFAHDIDPQPQHFGQIDACLAGAASVVGAERVGIYGGWLLMEHCAQVGNARWFCQTLAWEYKRGLHPAAHLYQYGFNEWIEGTECDLVRAMTANYGQASLADVPKDRDWKDAQFDQANAAGELPVAHTLIDEMPKVYDEAGRFGTSTAQAVAGCIAHRMHKQSGEWLQLSRAGIYYVGRERQYGKNEEELCSHESVWLPHVMEAMTTTGACREEIWPFDMDNLCPLPSAAENAPKVTIAGYWDMSNETPFADPGRSDNHQKVLRNHIMRCILTGCPVMFAIQLYDTFEPQGPDFEIPMPKPEDSEWMQHCMIIYGYDRSLGEHGMYKVQNSWGADWGYQGKCRIPMKYIDEQGRDFVSRRRAPK
jgi:hypothetical protein